MNSPTRYLLLGAVAWSLVAGASGARAAEEKGFVLVGPAVKSVIVIADGWRQHAWYDWGGHAILGRYAKQATGIDLPVMEAGKLSAPAARARYDYRIWIGRQPEVDRVIGERLDGLDDDGFIIHCTGRDLYLSGKHWWGTNWAAHDLLERFAGCRWYLMEPRWSHPQEDGLLGPGDIIPKAESIRLPADADLVEEPDYKSRWFRVAPTHSFRLRYRDRFHHNLWSILPDELLQSHAAQVNLSERLLILAAGEAAGGLGREHGQQAALTARAKARPAGAVVDQAGGVVRAPAPAAFP